MFYFFSCSKSAITRWLRQCPNVRMPRTVLQDYTHSRKYTAECRSRFSWGVCAHEVNQQSLSKATVIHLPKCFLILTFTHGYLEFLNPLLETVLFLQQNTQVWFFENYTILTKFILIKCRSLRNWICNEKLVLMIRK